MTAPFQRQSPLSFFLTRTFTIVLEQNGPLREKGWTWNTKRLLTVSRHVLRSTSIFSLQRDKRKEKKERENWNKNRNFNEDVSLVSCVHSELGLGSTTSSAPTETTTEVRSSSKTQTTHTTGGSSGPRLSWYGGFLFTYLKKLLYFRSTWDKVLTLVKFLERDFLR